MTPTLCVTCDAPVVVAQNGRVLKPAPSTLGVFDPVDGEPLTRAQVVELVRDTGKAGHDKHRCGDPQGALFDSTEVAR